jgi:hypothetical protein
MPPLTFRVMWPLRGSCQPRLTSLRLPEPRDLSEIRKPTTHARLEENSISFGQWMPGDQIVRALRGWRYGRDWPGKRRVPFAPLARLSGLSRQSLYQIIRDGRISDRHRAKLAIPVAGILDGGLRFKRRGQKWEIST